MTSTQPAMSAAQAATMAGELGARLRAVRQQRGMTVLELADAAGISRTPVYKSESGYWMPRVDSLIAIAGVLDVDLHWLLTGDEWTPRE